MQANSTPRGLGAHGEAVLDPAREHDGVARPGLDQLVAALERELALEHVVDLVLAGVDVDRRLGAGPGERLGERQGSSPVTSQVKAEPANVSVMVVVCMAREATAAAARSRNSDASRDS